MTTFRLFLLLTLALGGCKITTHVDGEGTIVSSPAGVFDCDESDGPDCTETYTDPTVQVLVATPDPGFIFKSWTGCEFVDFFTCETNISQGSIDDELEWDITATFKLIDPPVEPADYTYNAMGQRITKTVGGITTIFQYDLEGKLLAELDSSGNPIRQHIHVNGEPIAQISGAVYQSIEYVHADHLGTPTLMTDGSKTIVADIEATPFGDTFIEYAEFGDSRRFPGQYKDDESGLHYNYHRDYDPSLGRYIQSDPIGLQGGLNTYAYVGGNPVSFADPYGLKVEVGARGVDNTLGGGAHTFTRVTQSDGTITTISSHNVNGQNVILFDHPSDAGSNVSVTDLVEIPVPSGMTEAQFDQAVLDRAKKLKTELPPVYELFPDIYENFPDPPSGGNCHTTTTRLINGSGSRIPRSFNPRGLNPGLN